MHLELPRLGPTQKKCVGVKPQKQWMPCECLMISNDWRYMKMQQRTQTMHKVAQVLRPLLNTSALPIATRPYLARVIATFNSLLFCRIPRLCCRSSCNACESPAASNEAMSCPSSAKLRTKLIMMHSRSQPCSACTVPTNILPAVGTNLSLKPWTDLMLLGFVWGDDGDFARLALSFQKSNAGSNCYFSFPSFLKKRLWICFKGAKIFVPEPVVSSITIAECHCVRVHKIWNSSKGGRAKVPCLYI